MPHFSHFKANKVEFLFIGKIQVMTLIFHYLFFEPLLEEKRAITCTPNGMVPSNPTEKLANLAELLCQLLF